MKRTAILLCDMIVCFVAIEWSRLGPWDHLLGFSVYHSRGDVWLPTPPAAADFFRAMVSTGTSLFAIFFLAGSILIFLVGRSSAGEKRGTILQRAFYGDTRELLVKYPAVLFTSFISPFFYDHMRRLPLTPAVRIAGGLAITIAAFIVILAIGDLVARISHGTDRS